MYEKMDWEVEPKQPYLDAWNIRRLVSYAQRRAKDSHRRGQTPREFWLQYISMNHVMCFHVPMFCPCMFMHACMLNLHDEEPRVAALFAFIMSQKDRVPVEDDDEAEGASDGEEAEESAEATDGEEDHGLEEQGEEEKGCEDDPCVEDFVKEGVSESPSEATGESGNPKFRRLRSKSSDFGNDRQYENHEVQPSEGCVIVSETVTTAERAAKRAKLMALMQQITAAKGNRFHV